MNNKTSNPIAKKSQQWLFDALIGLMRDKPYDKISIKEIAQKADVDRSTFYRNFDTKEDVLKLYINELTEEYINRLKALDNLSMDKTIHVFINLCMESLEFFINLRNNDLSGFVLESFNEKLPYVQETLAYKWEYEIDSEYVRYALAFNAGGMWNMLMNWIDNGVKEPESDLVNAFREISKFNSYRN